MSRYNAQHCGLFANRVSYPLFNPDGCVRYVFASARLFLSFSCLYSLLSKEMKELILHHIDFSSKLILYDDPFWRTAVVDHLSSCFNRALRLFTPSPLVLRNHLRSAGAIITGDFAFWFYQ